MPSSAPEQEAPKPTYPVVTALTAVRKSRPMTQAELASRAGLLFA